MGILLNDSHCRKDLFPFTETRHTADIRIGILSIREKWELLLGEPVTLTATAGEETDGLSVQANIIPTAANYQDILQAARDKKTIAPSEEIRILLYPWHISQFNDWAIRQDFPLVTKHRASQPLGDTNRCVHAENIFIEEGATVTYSIINAAGGPVYIGKDTHIMEGNMIRGPFAICEGSVLKMGSKIYSGTTIGPWCVVGGEVKNSVFMGYSNKAHDGYLGDSVIGEWCNLGAGTSNSNVKNSAGDVKYVLHENLVNAGNKAGLIMGDYSRAAINTSFNTGSIVGICCNIFGRAFPAKITPSFTWGEERYLFDKVLQDIDNWKKLKNKTLTETEIGILNELYLSNQK
jgi:UDP-N-acetylglucosamine diphosphorylase/glucosamine-1-phosphate N-acetyltransferase